MANLSVHQTGVSLRFTPAGDFRVTAINGKSPRSLLAYRYYS